MKVYQKKAAADSSRGGTTASLWWGCKVVDAHRAQGCCEGLAHGLARTPSPALEEEEEKEKGEIELIIKKMSYEPAVLFECFSTLFMKVCTFLRDIIISLIISLPPPLIYQHRFSFQNAKWCSMRKVPADNFCILTWLKCLLNDRFRPFFLRVCLLQHTCT